MILSAGEALIDMLPRTTAEGADAFQPFAGGAVFNTAVALGRLDVPSGFFCGISTDLFGEILIDALATSHVDASFSARSDRPTTLAFVTLNDGHATYAFNDENTAGRMIVPDDLPNLSDDIQAVFFGGISLAVEPCADTFEALMTREAPNRVTMIDPNVRPSFIRDEDRYRARIMHMVSMADIVKLSDEDLHWLMGDGELADLAEDIRAKGPAIVLITQGAKGARGFCEGGVATVASRRTEVVDTVGAGDTFNAGVLAALHDKGLLNKDKLRQIGMSDLEDAMTLGAKCAAVTVSRAGANPPRRNEL